LSPEEIQEQQAEIELSRRVLSKRCFLDFISYISPWFKVSWHHEKVADALQRVEEGKLKRLIICLPPRHSKSEMVSVHFPPWIFGRNKDKSVIQTSYGDELSSEFGREARNIVASPEYRNIFTTTLAEDSQSKSVWSTNGRGKYNAVGIGGSVTGKGADFLIIDDPLKNRKQAESKIEKDNIYKWYKSTARTRLSPSGAIIIMATRWCDDDLIGMILSGETGEDWEVISLPAIAEEDEENRKKGDVLWSAQFDKTNIEKTKQEIGMFEFAALYQQNPINSETQEFTKTMYKYITEAEVRAKNTNCFITIDPAVKEKDNSDYTGTCINRVDDENVWYVKSSRKRMNSAKLIDHIFDLWKLYSPQSIGIEETTYTDAVYPFLKLEMIKRNVFPVIYGLKHHGTNKELRIRGLLPRYEAGKIFHIVGECETLEDEQARFPKGNYDDQVDAEAYQDQIVVAPEKPVSRMRQVASEMHVNDRTGYLE